MKALRQLTRDQVKDPELLQRFLQDVAELLTGMSSARLPSANGEGKVEKNVLTGITNGPAALVELGVNQQTAGAKSNIATVNPTAADDNSKGYARFSLWINTATNHIWQAADVTTTAAVWRQIS